MVNLGEAYRKLIGKTNKRRTKDEQKTNKRRTKNGASRTGRWKKNEQKTVRAARADNE